MGVREFLKQYFSDPILGHQNYNVYNTVVYAILFLFVLYIALLALKKRKIALNEKLFWSMVPFVVLGGVVRALGQYRLVKGEGILPLSFWFFTPGIYLLITFVAVLSLGISMTFKEQWQSKFLIISGGLLALLGLIFVLENVVNWRIFLEIIMLSTLVTILIWILFGRYAGSLASKANLLIVFGFVFDSVTTSIATAYLGYFPAHILTGLISSVSPFLLIPMKLLAILGALYVVEKDSSKSERWLLKLALLILSLPHGIHNSLQILMGV